MKQQRILFSAAIIFTFNFLLPASITAQRIAAGREYSAALCIDSTVSIWGNNFFGQLADSTLPFSYLPVEVSGLSGIVAIAGGENHVLALKKDGTVRSWGANLWGMLGDGSTSLTGCNCKYTPVTVTGLAGPVAVMPPGFEVAV